MVQTDKWATPRRGIHKLRDPAPLCGGSDKQNGPCLAVVFTKGPRAVVVQKIKGVTPRVGQEKPNLGPHPSLKKIDEIALKN